jgi:hypothetical protein
MAQVQSYIQAFINQKLDCHLAQLSMPCPASDVLRAACKTSQKNLLFQIHNH